MPASFHPEHFAGRLSALVKRHRIAICALLVVLAVVLHRPILHSIIERLIEAAAAEHGFSFSGRISGNVFSEIHLSRLRLKARHASKSGIDFVRLQNAHIIYNPLSLLRNGIKGSIRELSAEGVRICMHTLEPRETSASSHSLQTLASILTLPSYAPASIALSSVDVEISQNGQCLVWLRDGSILAKPDAPGFLRIGQLQFSEHPPLSGIETKVRYQKRKICLDALVLSPDLELSKFEFGESSENKGKADLLFELRDRNGHAAGEFHSQARTAEWTGHLEAEHFSCRGVSQLFGFKGNDVPEDLTGIIDIHGIPARSETWIGSLNWRFKLPIPGSEAAQVESEALISNGEMLVRKMEFTARASHGSLSGRINLPTNITTPETCSGTFSLKAHCNDLSEWKIFLRAAELRGRADINATVHINRGNLQSDWRCDLGDLESSSWRAQSVHTEGTFSTPTTGAFETGNIAGNALVSITKTTVATPEFRIDVKEALSAVAIADGALRFWNLQIKDGDNLVTGELSYPLTKSAAASHADLNLEFRDLGASSVFLRGHALKGALSGSFKGHLQKDLMRGDCALTGGSLKWGAFELGTVRFFASFEEGAVQVKELSAVWSPQEWIKAVGQVTLKAPFAYTLDASAQLPRLEKASALLRQLGRAHECSGMLEARLNGSGDLQTLSGTGTWTLKVKDARWDTLRFTAVDCSGKYVPGQLLAEPLHIATKDTKFSARLEWNQNTLHIENILLEQWGTRTLSGYLLLPVTRDENGTHWVKDARIAGQLRADKLDIANLYTGAGKPPQFAGSIQCSLALSGTPDNPSAAFNLRATDLRSKTTPHFGATAIEMSGGYSEALLSAEAKILSPLNAPVFVECKMPLHFESLFQDADALKEMPLRMHLRTTDASLKPAADLWTGLRQISGRASVDATITGSIRQPRWNAKISLDCPLVHFASDRAPALSDLHAQIDIDEKECRVRTLKADLGGGSLEIQGSALFEVPENPTLNFTARAREILAVRNRSLSLRLNGDLFLRGPWKHAVISGNASAVKSRVQWDIEVLPLTSLIPGGHKEQKAGGKPWFTFSRPPFSEWRFDVALASTPGDPLVLRGNRLRGTAEAELRLEGTGATPTLHGAYRTTDLVASLPFARIEMSRGQLWYQRDQPFLPQIDFSAETEVRNHRIRMYLAGPVEAPQISISSEPPLADTDLLTLLTTGALPSDATENSQALAGRAATVLFQEFSDKFLKQSSGREPFSALRRFSLDLSAINGRTGHQETRLTYRLTDKFFVIGEIGADGDFAGRFRYVLRFR